MHNRVRMITASFLVKHLRIHWQKGEKYFRDCLLDFNEANNIAGWQWVAGAARAGVRSTTRDESGRLILGDIIIELAGEQIQDSSDLYRTLDKLSVGETVDVTLLRGVDKVSARVTLDDVKDMKPPTASTIVIPMRTKKSPNSPY